MLFLQDDVVKQLIFIMKGSMRQYQMTTEGVERNIFFAKEKWIAL